MFQGPGFKAGKPGTACLTVDSTQKHQGWVVWVNNGKHNLYRLGGWVNITYSLHKETI